ncbi:MAG: VUT family protein [Oscillospiraceae bacterium]|nr:VUT family protein [Oscillospiraceae bacterium]
MNRRNKNGSWLSRESAMLSAMIRSVPRAVTILFILAVITMNFLARITLVSLPWLALNAGILVSWLSFLLMDIVAKHYGARAANLLSLVAIAANLLCSLVCVIISRVGNYPSLDMVVGGQWSILLASTIAYVISALTNNYTNVAIGRRFRGDPDGVAAYAARSFLSTFLSQIVDNFLFVFLAFVIFPWLPGALQVRWTIPQCIGASVACAVLELLSEVVFSPIGYAVIRRWKARGVGQDYLALYGAEG